MKKIILLFITAVFIGQVNVHATPDEGMWLPLLIKRLNAEDMAKQGCKLTADEIYQVNNAALKDAIVSLGFCTAEIVSVNGLLFTNHHCAYSAIQENSSVEHNYLDNGFWAKSYSEELRIPGQTASILVRMEDVTAKVLEGINDNSNTAERTNQISTVTKEIEKTASENGRYKALVKDMFNGNGYYLFVYETFNDVRLVGAPPQSIGKFGGDTDNWMWPRHTGDFALLRIYANKDNQPAEFSVDNVPYKPKHVIPVSLKGYKEDDFAMIMGFPGRTNRYITPAAMEMQMKNINPTQIKLFGKKLEIWKKDMDADIKVKIQYAAKYATYSNSWKYYIGQTEGLERLNVIETRQKEEDAYKAWANSNQQTKKYATVIDEYTQAINNYKNSIQEILYFSFAGRSSEAASMINVLEAVKSEVSKQPIDPKLLDNAMKAATERGKDFYKDYNTATDFNVMRELLVTYINDIPAIQLPPAIAKIAGMKGKTTHEKVEKWLTKLFDKSIFTSEEKYNNWLKKPDAKSFDKDPLVVFNNDILNFFRTNLLVKQQKYMSESENYKRLYLEGLMEYKKNHKFYPDANSTERLTYGTIKSYNPKDAVHFDYYTTAEGILQKFSKEPTSEFYVPEKLIDLIKKKDYGQYAEEGQLKVAFLTNNDITGGNSGSPVMNNKGELIGIAFDGNWEAMTGDLVFDSELKRTICVDIRYVLFIMDKFAGASNLISEMQLIK
ncbi:MAG: S46 family peptidase [Bacteroidia bacterium]|nr:S46 family peptidase [Bacteroidia bacterium]MCZ2248038.1 S46 family peptidase [Bacteroidia bacterium]